MIRERTGVGRHVHGTLDDPPIIVWQKRLVPSLMCLAAVGVGSFLHWLRPPSDARLLWSVLFGLFALCQAWIAIVRTGLILTPEGLAWRTGLCTRRYEWTDFEGFFVAAHRSKVVAAVFAESGKRRRVWFLRWSGSMAFGAFWELAPERIVDVLNEARTRWGRPRNAS